MMKTILIVEDDADSRFVLREELEYSGYKVMEACDGQEAITKAQREQPALILMDLGLPVLDGWEATHRLKADPRTCHIPIIVLTAYTMSADRERALKAGCDGYIAKPCDPQDVVLKVEEVFRESTT